LANEYRVGLVDADDGIRAGRRMVLESSGRVNITLELSTANELLERFADYLLDVLIIDQRLRGLSGVQVCEKISSIKLTENIDTRLLLTTPYSSDDLELQALRAGATAVVSQEAGSAALIDTVISLGARKRHYSMASIRALGSGSLTNVKRDHALESLLAAFELRERSILQSVVSGASVTEAANAFEVASYRVRKLVQATLLSLELVTLEQLQLRYLAAGLADDL
jgi:DNA-binding NarL/FixJ family response regulator